MFHREGIRIITIASLIIIALVILTARFLPLAIFIPVLIALLILVFLIFRFFRVPKRTFVINPNAVLSPADGTVVAIEQVMEPEYLKRKCTLVSVFMSIHDVHINWFPVSGEIKFFKYHPGKYLLARHPKSSELNERTTVVIDNDGREVLVRQIAGYVARRIICYASPGRTVKQGEELGFIRFGSRVDIYLPEETSVSVSLGERTYGGITEIGRLN